MDNNNPIRVLHVISRMPREGAQTFIMNLYRSIDRNKIQFDFLVNSKNRYAYNDEIERMGGRLIYAPAPNKSNVLSYIDIITNLIKENGPYKCVHSHSTFLSGVILKSAYQARVPIRISHAHNTNDGKGNSVFRYMYRKIMRKSIQKYSTNLFGCSNQACEYLYGANCFNDTRVKVINNGIHLDEYIDQNVDSKQLKTELGLPLDTILIGHVGRFQAMKNHGFLIDIFFELSKVKPESKLLLVGDGPLRKEIEKSVEDKNLNEQVLFLGVRDDVPKIMAALDVFLFPSKHEGLGIVLIEAQAAGTPCVVANTIPKEVDMGIDLIKFTSLNANLSEWVDNILSSVSMKKPEKNLIEQAIVGKGYDIKSVSNYLSNIYLGAAEQ